MQLGRLHSPTYIAASAATAAFQVAAVQQERFKIEMEEVSEKREKVAEESARVVDRATDRVRDVIDVSAEGKRKQQDTGDTVSDKPAPSADKPAVNSEVLGEMVNVTV